MISSIERNTILQEADLEHNGLSLLDSNALTVEVRQAPAEGRRQPRRVIMVRDADGELPATTRFKSNMLAITGMTGRLFKELPLDQLNRDITHQLLTRAHNIGYVKASIEDEMAAVSIFPIADRGYVPYGTMIPEGDLSSFTGSPLFEDSVSFMTMDRTLDLGGSPIFIGVHARASSNGMAKTKVHLGFYRTQCTNSAIDIGFGGFDLRELDASLFRSALGEMQGRLNEYTQSVESFIEGAQRLSISDQVFRQNALGQLAIPTKMKDLVELSASTPDVVSELLERAGVEHVHNLWEAFNVLTHLSSLAPTVSQRTTYAATSLTWAKNLMGIARN